ncbi:MoaD/ThiS family protein [Desulforamulus aeronauticus]|uniref:ThiS family protein n=1 Tax=Desulforamulus aeronauticus DSM 10349 TaxID=1121421 RepID=A0A1M6WWH7_9FIRM|nr:MoaD/ThiS family protein [Desulforamulus aeronauticus]SHK98130.1 ThiS family protein [Desulforamulus aeronauticus DSM 10349]
MGTIELRGFAKLHHVFKEKGLGFPDYFEVNDGLTGKQLIQALELNPEDVEAVMVNGTVCSMKQLIKPGDRVAILPPGTPGPYRVILGIVGKEA